MPFQIVVRLKDKGNEIYSPEYADRPEAEADLAKIKGALTSPRDPGLDWLAVQGRAVLSAHIVETSPSGFVG